MKKILLISVFLFSYQLTFALPTAIVKKLKGKVTYNNKVLSEGDKIEGKGLLVTGKKAYIRVFIEHWGNSISLGSRSKMKINLSSKKIKEKYSFLSGLCRWKTVVGMKPKNKNKKGAVFTKTAILGVRGTDFTVKVNKTLDETEIIVFDGQVELKNSKDHSNTTLINKGQWGGIGGRFGDTVSIAKDLPMKYIKFMDRKLK